MINAECRGGPYDGAFFDIDECGELHIRAAKFNGAVHAYRLMLRIDGEMYYHYLQAIHPKDVGQFVVHFEDDHEDLKGGAE